MKKLVFIAIAIFTLASCNNNTKKLDKNLVTTKNSNLSVYKGEFIYTADAAVLKGKDFIYGVTIDKKMQELANKVAPVKKDDFDMVPVVVTGTLANKPEGTEGWDEVLTIIDIVQISKKPAPADVKIEDKNIVDKKARAIQKK
ncbi:hypothetical protein ULMS_02020 [Patiriisocius marinistellae]|uniref:NlpE C-terminal OB domain-containing protein n=1 Tax=Patiriisocius marinistellae TaxID=2494560 RepID=A0A5J4FUK8_9FLAO|nr:hypothetical protein [Patiriisocius marinistellae]GEQ84694.1 hypothetical protein ULMS_02020 [Patiriisocius marinistellae]